jgi:uncharacterized protein (DUF2147 family)
LNILTDLTIFIPLINPETMKKTLFASIAILFVPLFLHAQASSIEGNWYNDKKSSIITVAKDANGRYTGTITWLETPNENGKPKVDDENPDPKLQNRPIMGLVILKNFQYDSRKKQWIDGRIYDPDNGKTYDCFAWFENGNRDVLYLKGYVAGIRALGRKTEWTRKK